MYVLTQGTQNHLLDNGIMFMSKSSDEKLHSLNPSSADFYLFDSGKVA